MGIISQDYVPHAKQSDCVVYLNPHCNKWINCHNCCVPVTQRTKGCACTVGKVGQLAMSCPPHQTRHQSPTLLVNSLEWRPLASIIIDNIYVDDFMSTSMPQPCWMWQDEAICEDDTFTWSLGDVSSSKNSLNEYWTIAFDCIISF